VNLMKKILFICFIFLLSFSACRRTEEKRTVVALPIYGQSLALGEEAIRVTDFEKMEMECDHRIKSVDMDERFGYFSDTYFKQKIKKILRVKRRVFETSAYGMSEYLVKYLSREGDNNTIIVPLMGGRGSTGIADLKANSTAYKVLIRKIKIAKRNAAKRGWSFYVPAVCWLQGETDIAQASNVNYKKALVDFHKTVSADIMRITGQKQSVKIVCYQSNNQTMYPSFNANSYSCPAAEVSQSQMELIRDSACFYASGPTYLYPHVRDFVHIDGVSQKRLGCLQGIAVAHVLAGGKFKGLIPENIAHRGDTVIVRFNVPCMPLAIDTITVKKAEHFGFKVITRTNIDIANEVIISGDEVKLVCCSSPAGCKVRYAVNGERSKMGNTFGPRGNLRDSQGKYSSIEILGKKYPLHNWCYQFDMLVK
jgi:hypothetical protein